MADPNTLVYVTRQVEFSAAHRLYRDELPEDENRSLFGKCANPYGHGHNYMLDVCIQGEVDPRSGMVVHFSELKLMLQELVVTPLDHRHLNHDVPFLQGILPTSENIVITLWGRIEGALQGKPWRLHHLRLGTTARNWVDYFGPKGF